MGGELQTLSAAETAGLLGWWLDMGVDTPVQDEPRNWLKPSPPPASRPAAPVPQTNVAEPSQETLAELRSWLASSAQLPLATATAKRILPHGPEEAPVMLLSDAPALEDFVAGQPIGGEAWALTVKMLAAIGIAADAAYVSPLSCFHVPGARLNAEDLDACATLARRHIALAKPKRLLLLGEGPARALTGKPFASARGHVHKIEGVRTVATFAPRHLLRRPSDKALAWHDLLLLMEDEV